MICDHCEVRATHDKHVTFFSTPMQLLWPHLWLMSTCIRHQCRICCWQILGPSLQEIRLELCQWCMNNASVGLGIPFLLCRLVTRSFSNIVMSFRTKSTITFLEYWNAAIRFWFHIKRESYLTRLQKGSMTGPSEYAQATYLTSLNHDLASVSVLGIRTLSITSCMDSEGVTLESIIFRHPNCTMSWQNWNLSLLSTMPFFTLWSRKSKVG